MKKILCVSIPVLLLISGIAVFGYMYSGNMKGKTSEVESDNNYLHNNAPRLTTADFDNVTPELNIINLQGILQSLSVPIGSNEDPGSNPPDDYFGILGNLTYPLKEIEIADTDEIVIIIRPSVNIISDKLDAYIACNTEVIKQVKDELCYFFTAQGTTPLFYISIYKNGFAIKKDVGIFGAHLSKLADEFKPVKRMNTKNSITVISVEKEFFALVNQ